MLETKVAEHVARVGKYALERLKSDFGPLPCVGGIGGGPRGLGLMLSMEIVADKSTKRAFDPALKILPQAQKQALEAGLFVRVTTIDTCPGDRICFCPPLIITKEEVGKALDMLYPVVVNICGKGEQ